MAEGLEKAKDAFHAGLDECRGCIRDLLGEAIIGLAACGLLALGWWGLRTAPYPTVSVAVGVLLFAGYGVVAYVRDIRGTKLAGRLGVAALLAAGVVVVILGYLPYCACLG